VLAAQFSLARYATATMGVWQGGSWAEGDRDGKYALAVIYFSNRFFSADFFRAKRSLKAEVL